MTMSQEKFELCRPYFQLFVVKILSRLALAESEIWSSNLPAIDKQKNLVWVEKGLKKV